MQKTPITSLWNGDRGLLHTCSFLIWILSDVCFHHYYWAGNALSYNRTTQQIISSLNLEPWFHLFKVLSLAFCSQHPMIFTLLWVSLLAQTVKNLPAMQETWVWSLGWEDPLEEGMATHSNILAWRIPKVRGAWQAIVHGVAKSRTQLSNWHFHTSQLLLWW